MINVAINGLGRIGRATLKIVMDAPDLNLVAANDLGASDSVEYLLKYDTVYGRYEKAVEATDDGHLKIGDHRLRLLREKDPARLPWKSLNVNVVFECTGAFTRRKDLEKHVAPAVRGHMRDLLAARDSRGKPVADVEQGHISSASCILANLSMDLGRTIVWDKQRQRAVNDDEANARLRRPYRSPWKHPEVEGV